MIFVVSVENNNDKNISIAYVFSFFSWTPSGLFPHVKSSVWGVNMAHGVWFEEAVYPHRNHFAVDLFETPTCTRQEKETLQGRKVQISGFIFKTGHSFVCYFIKIII